MLRIRIDLFAELHSLYIYPETPNPKLLRDEPEEGISSTYESKDDILEGTTISSR